MFLDVGAHTGQTVAAVRDPKFGFDRIVCFEPTAAAQAVLRRLTDPRVEVVPFGLWKETTERTIYEPGRKGASIFSDKARIDVARSEAIRLVRASDWFRENLGTADLVYAKLNCEGSECDILDDLLDSGEIGKLRSALVFLDVQKIPSQAHRAAEVKARLSSSGYSGHLFADELPAGTHRERVQWWLGRAGARVDSLRTRIAQTRFDSSRLAAGAIQGLLDRGFLGVLRGALPRGLYQGLQRVWHAFRGERVPL